jgi:hypothetical protein
MTFVGLPKTSVFAYVALAHASVVQATWRDDMQPRANTSAVRLTVGAAVLLLVTGCGPTAPSQSQSPTMSTSSSAQAPLVVITPSWPSVRVGELRQFTANLSPAITWSISGTTPISGGCTGTGCGTIDATGKYTAPATTPYPPNVVITATSVADPTKTGSARVLVFTPPPPSCQPSNNFEWCVNPPALDFGTQAVNTTSPPKTVTATNISSAALPIFGAVNGTPYVWRDYTATSDCPQVLAAGASCTFSITFTPSVIGNRNGSFLFIENAAENDGDLGDSTLLVGVGIAGS